MYVLEVLDVEKLAGWALPFQLFLGNGHSQPQAFLISKTPMLRSP